MRRSTFRLFAALLVAGASIFAFRPAAAEDTAKPAASTADAYVQQIEGVRKERVEGLKDENSWLTLVGLYWLDEGENRFGSSAENKVIFPEGKVPPVAGTLIRKGNAVSIRVEPNVPVTLDGKPVTAMDLRKDADGETTVLEIGSISFFAIQRGDRIGVRIKDKESPVRTGFHGLDFYPIRPDWRVEARFEPYKPAKKVKIPNVLGQVAEEDSPGAVVFERNGKTYRIDTLGSVDEGLFLIFADETNGKETYGAGRFLDAAPPKDGKVTVDFNVAYNPPCAFTAFATCPLPPAQNRLALRVDAGEKKFGSGHH